MRFYVCRSKVQLSVLAECSVIFEASIWHVEVLRNLVDNAPSLWNPTIILRETEVGVTLAKRSIENHGGCFWMESKDKRIPFAAVFP